MWEDARYPNCCVRLQHSILKSQGVQIISMGSGEPDFDTPVNIQKAAIHAIGAGETRYTAADGTPELKKAIRDKFKRENGLDYTANEVMVSCGGKQVFYNLCQAILNEGDEVIIPTPYWVSYPDMAILADATPVFIEAGLDQDFKITPQQLEASINFRSDSEFQRKSSRSVRGKKGWQRELTTG